MRAASGCHGCLWRLASRQRALGPPWRFPLRQPTPPSAPCRRSQDPERSAHSDRAASTHQRQPRSQDLVAERVRQDHSRNGGGVREGAAALCCTAYPARPLDLPSVRPSQHLHYRCGHCSGGGGGCVRAAAPVLVRVDHAQPTLATLATWQIMESSQTLLHVLKRESVNLTKKKQASS